MREGSTFMGNGESQLLYQTLYWHLCSGWLLLSCSWKRWRGEGAGSLRESPIPHRCLVGAPSCVCTGTGMLPTQQCAAGWALGLDAGLWGAAVWASRFPGCLPSSTLWLNSASVTERKQRLKRGSVPFVHLVTEQGAKVALAFWLHLRSVTLWTIGFGSWACCWWGTHVNEPYPGLPWGASVTHKGTSGSSGEGWLRESLGPWPDRWRLLLSPQVWAGRLLWGWGSGEGGKHSTGTSDSWGFMV